MPDPWLTHLEALQARAYRVAYGFLIKLDAADRMPAAYGLIADMLTPVPGHRDVTVAELRGLVAGANAAIAEGIPPDV